MPTEKEWQEALGKWQEAVKQRDEFIGNLKGEISNLGREVRYKGNRLLILEGLARLILVEAELPGSNEALLAKIVAALPNFDQAVKLLKEQDGIDTVLKVILPPPLEEEGKAKPTA